MKVQLRKTSIVYGFFFLFVIARNCDGDEFTVGNSGSVHFVHHSGHACDGKIQYPTVEEQRRNHPQFIG